jgi:glutaminyl-peptide cyclotransferase
MAIPPSERVEPQTGRVLEQRSVAGEYFAEGLTDWRDRLIQLTWTSKIGFVYDLATLRLQTTFAYTGEGWGLTHDDRRLIMSDGSAALRFLDPETFKELGRVMVTDAGRPVERLNELEFVNGRVYANVWLTERIAVCRSRFGARRIVDRSVGPARDHRFAH